MSLVPYVHLDAALADAPVGAEIPLSADEAHHLTTVLRLPAGAVLEVADGRGNAASAELAGRVVRLTAPAVASPTTSPSIALAQALPKGRKFDEVVRQVTELGVDRIWPMEADRSVVRLRGPKAERAVARWEAVARAACEQARRPTRPLIEPIAALTDLAEAEVAAQTDRCVLVAHPGAPGLPSHLDVVRSADEVVVVVGPEGGLTTAEVAVLRAAGARPVGMGTATLRTEHAAAAAIAVLAAGVGRWG